MSQITVYALNMLFFFSALLRFFFFFVHISQNRHPKLTTFFLIALNEPNMRRGKHNDLNSHSLYKLFGCFLHYLFPIYDNPIIEFLIFNNNLYFKSIYIIHNLIYGYSIFIFIL